MRPLLAALESSGLGQFLRESGPWTYPIVNLLHILGIGALFGAVLVLDLRLLGLWRRAPLDAVSEAAQPVAATGFALAAASGVALISVNATEYAGNPFLLIKFPAIALGAINALALRRTAAWRRHREPLPDSDRRLLAGFAAVSLVSWLTAIAAGRLIGYW